MRRVTALLLAVVFSAVSLSGCGEKASFSEVSKGIDTTNAVKKYKANFITEMTFENDTATLLYEQGSYSIDRENQQLYSDYVRTYFGASEKLTEMYKDCYVYTDNGSEKQKYQSKQEFLNYLQYSDALGFNEKDVSDLKKDTNSSGTLYTFKVKNGYDDKLKTIIGDNIYSLAKINNPQKDKTHFSEIECEYTFKQNENGETVLANRQTVFTVYLYDTPAYTPGFTPPESDYRLDLKIRIKVTYTGFDTTEISEPTGDFSTIS